MKKLLLLIFIFIGVNSYSQNIDKDTVNIKEVEVIANLPYQATKIMPVTFKNITKKDLSYQNYGQEPSQILNNTPSVTSFSDAGSGWSYSYFRLRGMDQTRINMTLNGVPLNEPEDQGCYFSNYPDFLQSINMLQIQRGVGMSKNGVSNFAGSLNFEALNPSKTINLSSGIGSFDSRKFSLGLGSKNLYGRFSSISSDGYRDHSKNTSKSFFFTADKKYNKSTLKLIAFAGNQKNKLAWLGSTKEELDANPKFNSCTDNEHDNFSQFRVQLHHNYNLNKNANLNSALYYNYLKGSYTYQYDVLADYAHTSIDDYGSIDMYNLKSNTVGFYTNYSHRYKNLIMYSGVNFQLYSREHNGQTWVDVNKYINHRGFNFEYFNTGFRTDQSAFFKMVYNFKGFNIFQDYQFRNSIFRYEGDIEMDNFNWGFFNPTVGIEKSFGANTLYYSIGKTHREPTRNDIFMGMDNLYDESSYLKMKPESVIDNELGYRYSSNKSKINVNLYYMKFKDEITLNGYFGPTGLLLHSNVDNSFRSGLEFDGRYKIGKFEIYNSSSFSYNKIKVDTEEYNPVLTPNVIVNQGVLYKFNKSSIHFTGRYQGESYIDLENNHKLEDFFSLNAGVNFRLTKRLELDVFVNNITNKGFYTNGLISFEGDPLYFRQASINCFANLKYNF